VQIVVVLPEATYAHHSYASLTRLICGVPLQVRTLATAQRAGADEVVVVAPESMPLNLAEAFLEYPVVRKRGNVRLMQLKGFNPDECSSWIALQNQLDDRFVWLPWNWATNVRLLANLPDSAESHTNWAVPGWVSKSTVVLGRIFQPQTRPLPEAWL
jgi:hypothetical protein